MEALGITNPPPLTVDAAQGLLPGRLPEAGGLLAVLQEAQENGVPLTKDNLKEIVLRRADYLYWSKDGKEGVTKPAAKTYAEYKQDCLMVKKLGDGGDWNVVADAQKLDGDLADNLVKVCAERKKLPRADKLLVAFTGKALEDVVAQLSTVAQTQADMRGKVDLWKTRKAEIKAIQQGGLAKLKEEELALRTELEAVGALKAKGKQGAKPDDGAAEAEPSDKPAASPRPAVEPGSGEFPKAIRVVFQVEAVIYDPGLAAAEFIEQVKHGDLVITGWPDELVVSQSSDEEEIGKLTEIDWQMAEVEEQDAEDDLEPEDVPSGDD